MRQVRSTKPSWQTLLLLVAGVVIGVIIALLLAQTDTYQSRSLVPLNSLPVVDLEATAAAGKLVVIYLPGEASPAPVTHISPTRPMPVAEETTVESECSAPLNWVQYNIRVGDTLPKLARAHGTSVYYLMKANCLERPFLMAGQKLFLPISPPALARPTWNEPHPIPGSETLIQPDAPFWPIATLSSPSPQ